MRTVADIKEEITTAFMGNETLATLYGFQPGASFDDHFSVVSVENLIIYIVAFSIYSLEKLFDLHRGDMLQLLDTKRPHRLKWYYDKAMAFQLGRPLLPDSDMYDTVVETEKVVKHASVVEYQGKLFIKVAKGESFREPLTETELTALRYYFSEVKDAGVVLELLSKPADHIAITIYIYYDPMVLSDSGVRLDTGDDVVRKAIKHYVEYNIPFNGQYRNTDLTDILQQVDGVVIPELKQVSTVTHDDYMLASPNEPPWVTIDAYHNPMAGYYKIYDDSDLNIIFTPYKSIETP